MKAAEQNSHPIRRSDIVYNQSVVYSLLDAADVIRMRDNYTIARMADGHLKHSSNEQSFPAARSSTVINCPCFDTDVHSPLQAASAIPLEGDEKPPAASKSRFSVAAIATYPLNADSSQ